MRFILDESHQKEVITYYFLSTHSVHKLKPCVEGGIEGVGEDSLEARKGRGGQKEKLSLIVFHLEVFEHHNKSTHPHTGGDKNVQGANGCI